MTRVLVDADACPVRAEIDRAARRAGVAVILFANKNQGERLEDEATVIRVSDRPDAVDFAIVTHCAESDVVVTDDVGLAAMVVRKGAAALNSRGRLFRAEEMDGLLHARHVAKKVRRAGGRTRGPRGLTTGDRRQFRQALDALLRKK